MGWRLVLCLKRRLNFALETHSWRWSTILWLLRRGCPLKMLGKLRASEREALAAVNAVVVTSTATQRYLVEDYAVPVQRIFIAPPGSDPVAPAKGSTDGVVHLLSVGAIVPRKGFDVLIAALGMLTRLPWRLTIVGDPRVPDTRPLGSMLTSRVIG